MKPLPPPETPPTPRCLAGTTPGLKQQIPISKKKIPIGRFAQREEIALAAQYLASGAAGLINGENLVVDGGYTAT